MPEYTAPPIPEDEAALFEALTQGDVPGAALLSVTLDWPWPGLDDTPSEPTVAICQVTEDPMLGDYRITPLYIRVTPQVLDRLRDPMGDLPDA